MSNDKGEPNFKEIGGQKVARLGSGTYGEVYYCQDKKGKQVIKVQKRPGKSGSRNIQQEAKFHYTLCMLKIPNIPKFLDSTQESFKAYKPNIWLGTNKIPVLTMQYIRGYTLFEVVTASGYLQQDFARYFFLKMLDTVQSLHKNKYTHNDIKIQNMMINENSELKIIDLGMCKEKENSNQVQKRRGSHVYMSPEMLQTEVKQVLKKHNQLEVYFKSLETNKYSQEAADLYALAVSIFTIMMGQRLFKVNPTGSISSEDNYVQLVRMGKTDESQNFWKRFNRINTAKYKVSEQFKKLMQQMLHIDPKKRPNIKQIRESNWCKMPVDQQGIKSYFNTRYAKCKYEYGTRSTKDKKKEESQYVQDKELHVEIIKFYYPSNFEFQINSQVSFLYQLWNFCQEPQKNQYENTEIDIINKESHIDVRIIRDQTQHHVQIELGINTDKELSARFTNIQADFLQFMTFYLTIKKKFQQV